MPSQYGEHERVLDYFGERHGRFLDIGAHDGITFSNTRVLADLAWGGVLVEPSPASFVHLMHNYAERTAHPVQPQKMIHLVNAGLAEVPGLMKFWANTKDGLSADALSSFKAATVAKSERHPFREIWVSSITWDMLLGQHQGPYQFVNIDVEGMNSEILTGLCDRMAMIKPEMVCVELDPESETSWMKWKLERACLSKQEIIGGNLLAWR